MYYILDTEQNAIPVDITTWARWMQSADRVIQSSYVGDVHISTVFLAYDHAFNRTSEPVLFETMLFGGNHDQELFDRYSTYAEAEQGHERAMKYLMGRNV